MVTSGAAVITLVSFPILQYGCSYLYLDLVASRAVLANSEMVAIISSAVAVTSVRFLIITCDSSYFLVVSVTSLQFLLLLKRPRTLLCHYGYFNGVSDTSVQVRILSCTSRPDSVTFVWLWLLPMR